MTYVPIEKVRALVGASRRTKDGKAFASFKKTFATKMSDMNAARVYCQKPTAQDIRGTAAWSKENRILKTGATKIEYSAPVLDDAGKVLEFKTVFAFDISDTVPKEE